MKLNQLLPEIGGRLGRTEIAGITCDSRKVERGWAFVCIDGTVADGHDYARQAQKAGAAVIITARHLCRIRHQVTLDNTRLVWSRMCAAWFGHPADKLRMVGVTGTSGKTSVTYLTKSLLEAAGIKTGLIGTIQNMSGDRILPAERTTPDAYDLHRMLAEMVKDGCECAVMEVSSHALDQDRAAGIAFEAGIFTNLTQDHLDYHVTMENYAAAKKRLFLQSRCAILNYDDPWTPFMKQDLTCPVKTFSASADAADFTAREIRHRPDGVEFVLVGEGAIGRLKLPIPGRFTVYNALAAATCALQLGVPFDDTVRAFERVRGVKGRAEVVPTGRDFTLVIDYAHTPDELDNICKTLRESTAARLITVFGCGGDRDRGKRPKMAAAAAMYSDRLVVTSDNPRTEDPQAIIREILTGLDGSVPYEVIENRPEAIRAAMKMAQAGDTVLLAGKGHETYQILADRTIHLDEREVVADVLAEMANETD